MYSITHEVRSRTGYVEHNLRSKIFFVEDKTGMGSGIGYFRTLD